MMEKALRDLLQANKEQAYPLCPENTCTACDNLRKATAAAESALEHSGWRKWPEEKPEKECDYLVVDDGLWYPDTWIEGHFRDHNNITHWMSIILPEVPNE
jgi:hypothetical protein